MVLIALFALGVVLRAAGWPPAPAAGRGGRSEPVAQNAAPAPDAVGEGAASANTAAQYRAFWVDAFHEGAKSPAQVERLVADVQAAGANIIIVQVRRRGDAYYLRLAEPRTEDPALASDFDALQAVIERAHAAQPRIEVHAWIATLAIWNRRDQRPAAPNHVFNQHGASAPSGQNWLARDVNGEQWDGENYMLDPGHPDAARYVADVAAEVVSNYDVDGVHLDLVRYAGARWGYNPVSVARFRNRLGGEGPPAPSDARWQQWRRDQVTALVRRVYLAALGPVGRHVVVGVGMFTTQAADGLAQLQNALAPGPNGTALDGDGTLAVANLPPGAYSPGVEVNGHWVLRRAGIHIEPGRVTREAGGGRCYNCVAGPQRK